MSRSSHPGIDYFRSLVSQANDHLQAGTAPAPQKRRAAIAAASLVSNPRPASHRKGPLAWSRDHVFADCTLQDISLANAVSLLLNLAATSVVVVVGTLVEAAVMALNATSVAR